MPTRQRTYVWLLPAGIAAAAAIAGYLVFELGRIQADYSILAAAAERREYQAQIERQARRIVELEENIALLETHRDIDREAYRQVEASLSELQDKIQEQRDAIAFYRGIISPADGGRGLRVQDLKLRRGSDERRFYVRLVLVQALQHDSSVNGDVALSLEGHQDGVTTTYSWEQLVPEDEDSAWPFSFRYFQNFDRQLVLPAGFEPEKVHIEVRSRTKSVASVSQSFLWQTGQG